MINNLKVNYKIYNIAYKDYNIKLSQIYVNLKTKQKT